MTEIEALQPDFRANPTNPRDACVGSPLWVLNELANIDKHRFNPVHRVFMSDMRGEVVFGEEAVGEVEVHGDLEEGTTFFTGASYFATDSGEAPDMHMHGQGTVDIFLEVPMGPPPYRRLVPLAEEITAFVRDALPRFSRFF